MTKLKTADLFAGYEKKAAIHDITFEIPEGKITSLIGPNGSGKSTLLKALARILHPMQGNIQIDGVNISTLDTKAIAQKIASLSQTSSQVTGLKVEEVVAYGRFPYRKGFSGLKKEDQDIIEWTLEATNLQGLKDRELSTLSGGQRQRVWIAMALAQDTDILILDEPITFLDPAHQLEILHLLEALNRQGKTILMTIHDLNHAARFSDHILGLREGRLIMEGTPAELYTEGNMRKLFDIQAVFVTPADSGKPQIINYQLVKGAEAHES